MAMVALDTGFPSHDAPMISLGIAGQLQFDPIFVLDHTHRQFEESEHDRIWLSIRKLCVLMDHGSQGVVQYIGCTGKIET